jgi:hypothetical protein
MPPWLRTLFKVADIGGTDANCRQIHRRIGT